MAPCETHPSGAASGALPSVSPPPRRITFAIIGCGRAGQFHMTSLRQLSNEAKLKWVVDVELEKAAACAQREQCQASADAADVWADAEVDAVVICSVTHSHAALCKAALLAGKAVLTEKPVSHNPQELKEILTLADSTGLPFLVGYQRRVDKNFRELKRQVDQGAVGGLRLIKCCSRDNPLPPIPYLQVSGGIFCDMLCHDFDMLHYLSGEMPTEVHSMGHCYNEQIKAMDDIDTVVVSLKFESGLMAMVDSSRTACYGYDQRVEVFGEKGMACTENERQHTVTVATQAGFQTGMTHFSFPERYKNTYFEELQEFVGMVQRNEKEPPKSHWRHMQLELVTSAAELSWRLGRLVKLEEVDALRGHLPH